MTFETALKTLESLASGQLQPLVGIGAAALVVVFALFGVLRQYLTGERPPNLLTPSEHRTRQRLSAVHDLLERSAEPWTRELLRDEAERLQFLLVTGINAKATLRRQVWALYQEGPVRLSWRDLRTALPYLRVRDGQLVGGLDRVDRVMLWLGRAVAVACLVLAAATVLTSLWGLFLKVDVWPLVALGLFFVLVAGAVATVTLPLARASQLQRALPDRPVPATATDAGASVAGEGQLTEAHPGATADPVAARP